jgi:hypothetical protein
MGENSSADVGIGSEPRRSEMLPSALGGDHMSTEREAEADAGIASCRIGRERTIAVGDPAMPPPVVLTGDTGVDFTVMSCERYEFWDARRDVRLRLWREDSRAAALP